MDDDDLGNTPSVRVWGSLPTFIRYSLPRKVKVVSVLGIREFCLCHVLELGTTSRLI